MCILCVKLAPRITEVVLARMLGTLLTIEMQRQASCGPRTFASSKPSPLESFCSLKLV